MVKQLLFHLCRLAILVDEYFLLTDLSDGGKMIHKAKVYSQASFKWYRNIHDHRQDKLQNISNLTELDLSNSNLDFKRIIDACPQLQRLNLEANATLRLEDLQIIATCCCDLQGLNLMGIMGTLVTGFDFFVKVWKILSSMKLIHLSMNASLYFGSLDDVQEKQLIPLLKRCTKLQALELFAATGIYKISNFEMLSHFPSLEHLRLSGRQHSICIQEVLTACNTLRCFYCYSSELSKLSLSAHNNLQQLYIYSRYTDLDDKFMDTCSVSSWWTDSCSLPCSLNDCQGHYHSYKQLIKSTYCFVWLL